MELKLLNKEKVKEIYDGSKEKAKSGLSKGKDKVAVALYFIKEQAFAAVKSGVALTKAVLWPKFLRMSKIALLKAARKAVKALEKEKNSKEEKAAIKAILNAIDVLEKAVKK